MTGNFRHQSIALILSTFVAASTYSPFAFGGLPAPCDGSASSSSSNSNTAVADSNLNSGTSTNSNTSSAAAASANNQTATYCTAAKNADDAASAQEIGTIIWSTVAGVCAVPCALYATGYGAIASEVTLGRVCMGVDLAGTASDLVLTMTTSKKFSDSLTSLANVGVQGVAAYLESGGITALFSAGGGGQALAQQAMGKGFQGPMTSTASNKAAGNNSGQLSCITTAIAAATALVKGIEMGQSDKTRDQNIQNAQQLSTSQGGSAVGGTATNAVQLTQANAASNGTAVGSGQATSASNVATNGGSAGNALASCASQSGGSTSAMLSCATSGNPKLQALVTNPDFLAGLQKTSGMDPGAFFNSIPAGASTGDIMAASLGGIVSPQDTKNKMAGTLSDLNSQILAAMNASGSSQYASSGTGAGSKPSLGVSNLFGSDGGGSGVVGTAGETTQFRKTASLDVGGLNFKTDSDGIMQDRSVNLFEAVTAQYKKSKDGIEERPWAVPYNKYKMGQ